MLVRRAEEPGRENLPRMREREEEGADMTKFFPTILIALFIGAAIEAAWGGEWKMAVFYGASAAINVVVL